MYEMIGCNSDDDCLGSNEKCDIADKICRPPCFKYNFNCYGNNQCDPSTESCVPCKEKKIKTKFNGPKIFSL